MFLLPERRILGLEGKVDRCGRNSYIIGMKVVVSEKGQVTIPKALRDSLGIAPGSELEFEEREGHLVAVPVVPTDPLEALVGLLPAMEIDTTVSDLRGSAWTPGVDGGRGDHRRR